MSEKLVVIRGAGDLATGVAHKLHRSGFRLLMLEIDKPTVIRQRVAFATAIYDQQITVDGVTAVQVADPSAINNAWEHNMVPVIIDPECQILSWFSPNVLVDAILAKKNIGTQKNMAPITIAIGPGFIAGQDVDIVIETNRGHNLGRLLFSGAAEPNTGEPSEVMGYGQERVVRATAEGIISNTISIGDQVVCGQVISLIDDIPVIAAVDGVMRGLIREGLQVKIGTKIADIDPRGIREYCWTISEKARAIGGGVLEAILYLQNQPPHK